ncbi:hypothetical protein [uncultured Maribacter sp.]|uniref:hypothetical protein n=1 Tax=uncultured Maribacter sp. TaxID=431308 RepID=UPI002617B4A8|nr:hypothetical protein [uncultured Maribacter sp.]
MQNYQLVLHKINLFIRKYYSNMLIKGALLFIAFALLFCIGVLGLEYFLWLNSTARFLLFFFCIAIVLFLFVRYICIPLFYLFKIKKGISNKEASVLIGRYFPEVGDTLYNLLDLDEDQNRSELLLASIEQRSANLKPIHFVNAVNFKDAFKYAKYIGIPFLLILVIGASGNLQSYFSSYKRVINYDIAYEAPAPFSFHLLVDNLEVLENKDFTIYVEVVGEFKPEEVYMVVEDKELLLQKESGRYYYTFSAPLTSCTFFFKGNDVMSRTYNLLALKTPSIEDFKMNLEYPSYTGLSSEVIEGTGNAKFPEGTKVTWKVNGKNTDNIHIVTNDTIVEMTSKGSTHSYQKIIYDEYDYVLTTSNQNIKEFEKLSYTFLVVKDANPSINVRKVVDSLRPNIAYFNGSTTDDYRVKKIQLFCYETDNEEKKQSRILDWPNSNYYTFYYTFPSGLNVEKGKAYSLYFEVTDNDGIHGGKVTKSEVFSLNILNDKGLINRELSTQKAILGNFDKSLEKVKEQKESLKELQKNQKENNSLDFNKKNEVRDFLKHQKEQESLMQKFSKQLKDNLKKRNPDSGKNKLLQERLERQELLAKRNEQLLEELSKVADKINKEELSKKLDELSKKQKNSERNLEQLLELTKRYYVTEKIDQLANELKEISEKQKGLSEDKKEENSISKQEELNREFVGVSKELKELKLDNEALKKPLSLDIDSYKQQSIKDDQKEATKALKENVEEGPSKDSEARERKASKKQKSAAQRMKEMSESLEDTASSSDGGSGIAEDAEMLRQILDNLITFSFKQEDLYGAMNYGRGADTQFGNQIKKQQELRLLFEHVDDSLFALSLRREELSEFVNEQITEVYYNIDKTLINVADGRLYQGASNQKYVLTAANSLSDFLVNVLDNMEQSMKMGKGDGNGQQGFQLPDIIKAQGSLKDKMDGSGKPGNGNPGGKSGDGNKGNNGVKGKGKDGGESAQGIKGKAGKGANGAKGMGKEGGEKTGNSNSGQGYGSGQGQGMSASELKEIYEIYQSQQTIRNALEKQLSDMLNANDRKLGEKILRQMEDFENDLLENGITQRTASKANIIEYELLKLENAALKKGKKAERESNTSTDKFGNAIITKPSLLDNYHNETEILNRQSLPLRHNFQNRVKLYFKKND